MEMLERNWYRGKTTNDKEWKIGYLSAVQGMSKTLWTIHPAERSMNDIFDGAQRGRSRSVEEATICKCSGLKDKNKKLIFENDILMCHDNPSDLVKAVFGEFTVIDMETEEEIDDVIGWHYEVLQTDALRKCAPFCYSRPLTGAYIEQCNMKVVGNIFDNPELLNGEGNEQTRDYRKISNFDRIKACDNEWEMAGLLCNYISDNLHRFRTEEGYFDDYSVLEWLRSNSHGGKQEDDE